MSLVALPSEPRQPAKSAGDAMIEAIADAVALRLERMAVVRQRLLDIHQAAEYLGMSEHALRHKAGVDVPCTRIDGKLRFDHRDLDRDSGKQSRSATRMGTPFRSWNGKPNLLPRCRLAMSRSPSRNMESSRHS